LDAALAYRNEVKERRRSQRIGVHAKAKELGIKPTEVLAYEYGYDLCKHTNAEKQLLGFPKPLAIFQRCVKCGMPIEGTTEKITDKNIKESYRIFKKNREEEMAKGEVKNAKEAKEGT